MELIWLHPARSSTLEQRKIIIAEQGKGHALLWEGVEGSALKCKGPMRDRPWQNLKYIHISCSGNANMVVNFKI